VKGLPRTTSGSLPVATGRLVVPVSLLWDGYF